MNNNINILIVKAWALLKENKIKEAELIFEQAQNLYPKNYKLLFNYAVFNLKIKKIKKSIALFEKTIKINSIEDAIFINLGLAYTLLPNIKKAIHAYEKAIAVNSNNFIPFSNIAILYKNLKKYEKSEEYFTKAIKLKNDSPELFYNIARLYIEMKYYDRALLFFKKSLNLNPNNLEVLNELGYLYLQLFKYNESIDTLNKAIKIDPNHYLSISNYLFVLGYTAPEKYPIISNNLVKNISRNSDKNIFFNNIRNKEIHIGFISGDFRNHAVSYFLLDFLKEIKKKKIKIFAYYNNNINDNLTLKLKKIFDGWNEIYKKNNSDIKKLIVEDNIDILFDISGYTGNNKLDIFVNRSAPIQVSWLGWSATTGVKEIDYIIGDSYLTPIKDQKNFTETIFNLKNIWTSMSSSLLDCSFDINKLSDEYLCFGSFCAIPKINNNVIKIWSKILNQTKNSKLLLKNHYLDRNYAKNFIYQSFSNYGVSKEKLILEGSSGRNQYLETYNKIDIILDTFPFNAGTTNFEAAYMGVPIITLENNSFYTRQGESINKNLDMEDWIAKSEEDYIKKSLIYSDDKSKIKKIKIDLCKKASHSSLFDSKRFAEDFYEMLVSIYN